MTDGIGGVTVTASQIRDVLRGQKHGPLEVELLTIAAELKQRTNGAPVFICASYPGNENAGGVVFEYRRFGLLARLAWWCSRKVRL